MEYMNISFFLFILLVILFFVQPNFFETMYNSKIGRFIIIISLVIISLNSFLLAILLIIIIIFLSQNKKKVIPPPEKIIKETTNDQLTMEEVVKKINNPSNEKFLFKKYDKNLYKKSKRENGVNVVQLSELIRPKSSKIMVVGPNTSNNTLPYSKENYYKF